MNQYKNNANTTLAADLAIGGLSLTVADGAVFPALGAGQTFWATIEEPPPADPPVREVVSVTARAGNVLTIVRAQQGTAAAAWTTGALVELRWTADDAEQVRNAALLGAFGRR